MSQATTINFLPPEVLSLVFELVRDSRTSYSVAQSTLSSASLVSRSWRHAQLELAREVQLRRHARLRSAGRGSSMITEWLARPWLNSASSKGGRCRVLTLPGRLVDASPADVLLGAGEALEELTLQSWTDWGLLRTHTLTSELCDLVDCLQLTVHPIDLKTLRLNASLTDPDDSDNLLPFQLTHIIWDDLSDLTPRFLTALFTSSLPTLTHLTLCCAFPGFSLLAATHLPIILPTLHYLALNGVMLESSDLPLFGLCNNLRTLVYAPTVGDLDSVRLLGDVLDALPRRLNRLVLSTIKDLGSGSEEEARVMGHRALMGGRVFRWRDMAAEKEGIYELVQPTEEGEVGRCDLA